MAAKQTDEGYVADRRRIGNEVEPPFFTYTVKHQFSYTQALSVSFAASSPGGGAKDDVPTIEKRKSSPQARKFCFRLEGAFLFYIT